MFRVIIRRKVEVTISSMGAGSLENFAWGVVWGWCW